MLSRRGINRIKSTGQYIPYRKAVYMNCGLNRDVVYYESSRSAGSGVSGNRSGSDSTERTSLALDSFIYFTNVLEQFSMLISCVFLAITVGVGGYILANAFGQKSPVEGWLSTMGFLAMGFLGVFSLLTIVLKYLSAILGLIFRQQKYLVADIEKIGKTETKYDNQE